MSNSENTLAIFYNFKDEQTCPFCKLIKELYDIGGSQKVIDRLGVIDPDNHKHNFARCFVHHYWITEIYGDDLIERPVREVVKEGVEVFKEMKNILAIK